MMQVHSSPYPVWRAGAPVEAPKERGLPERPDLPGKISLGISDRLPTLHDHGIAGHRQNRLAQSFFHHRVSCEFGHVHIRCLYRNNHSPAAIARQLDGMQKAGTRGRFVAIIPQLRRHKNEQQNQRNHHVVVKASPRISPVKIALQNLTDPALWLWKELAISYWFHHKSSFIKNYRATILSSPPIYGRSASGIRTAPSACCYS